MMGFGILILLLFGQEPHDLDCRGRFEVLARVEPTRILVGEDVTLTLRIVALGPWKRGPQRPPLVEDGSLLSSFRVRDLPNEATARFPEGLTGPTGTAWEFSWKLTPIQASVQPFVEPIGNTKGKDPQNRSQSEVSKASYPSAIPEIGLILTRDDVPWPRLAREMLWVGPFPLTYRHIDTVKRTSEGAAFLGWTLLGIGAWVFLTIACMFVYESILFNRSQIAILKHLTLGEPIEALGLRRILHGFLKSKGFVLTAEPDALSIGQAALRAGYPPALATSLANLWSSLDQAAFGLGEPNLGAPMSPPQSPPQEKELAKQVLGLAGSKYWRFWKRRLLVNID